MFHPLQRRPPASIYSYCARWEARPGPGPGPAPALWSRYQWLLGWFQREPGKCPGPKSLLSLLASQCSYVTGQRVRRAQQIGQLYGNIYSERARWSLFSGLWRRFQARHASACKLMAALTGVFLWEEERIQEEELRRSAEEMKHMEEVSRLFHGSGGEHQKLGPKTHVDITATREEHPWEMVMDKKHFKLWRRPIEGTHLYQYRVFGTYTDVTPRQFFNVQMWPSGGAPLADKEATKA